MLISMVPAVELRGGVPVGTLGALGILLGALRALRALGALSWGGRPSLTRPQCEIFPRAGKAANASAARGSLKLQRSCNPNRVIYQTTEHMKHTYKTDYQIHATNRS